MSAEKAKLRRSKAPSRAESKSGVKAVAAPLPPTISQSSLMVDGSDALIRRITHRHFVLSGLLERIRSEFAALIGVTTFQYVLMQALARLEHDKEWTVGAVAREMRMTDAYVSTEISDLVRQGLLAKVVNPDDRRVSFLAITPKGRASLIAIAPIQQTVNDTLYGHMNRKAAIAYAEALDQLVVYADKAGQIFDDVSARQRSDMVRRGTSSRRQRKVALAT
jgi:DNA-binding MarR family transcriptional regulator